MDEGTSRSRGKERHMPLEPLPIGPPQVIEQGWLLKRSDGKHSAVTFGNVIKDWKKRWFLIRDGTLAYSKEASHAPDNNAAPDHLFQLVDCAVRQSKSAQFAVLSRERLLTLCAASSAEAEAWVAALVAAGAEISVDEPAPRPPNAHEREALKAIGEQLSTPVDWAVASHLTSLERVWHALRLSHAGEGGALAFSPDSAGWRRAGFLSTDPAADLRGGGEAALSFLAWYADAAPDHARAAAAHQLRLREESGGERGLPWAAAAVECVRIVADLLEAVTFANTPGGYGSSLRRCWSLVQPEDGFFSLVLVAIDAVEREFEAAGWKYASFRGCVGKVKNAFSEALGEEASSGCGSQCELRHALRLPPRFAQREYAAARPPAEEKGKKIGKQSSAKQLDCSIRNLVLGTSVELDREIDRQMQLPSR
ncbi:hypothetical protein AB1Y20_022055 [Prymnesium parvum]|uniref:PH domain-containing protein n=1 Tax=Prymnesium parvum TaxID=97485 RepID=A0AB34JG04_PRYPA